MNIYERSIKRIRILAAGAHLDDIELACGGTLTGAIGHGNIVKMVVMSKPGYTNYDGKLMRTDEEVVQEDRYTAGILGVSDIQILDFENKNVQYHYTVIETLDKIINDFNPDIMFIHHIFDTRQSHEGTAESTLSVARRRSTVYMYEPMVLSGRSYVAFHPQMYTKISKAELKRKIEALRTHKTEYYKFGEFWIDGVKARAVYRGYEMGAKYAGVSKIIRYTLEV